MAKENEVAVVKKEKQAPVITGNSPADMIRMAISSNADLDKLEKLLTLQVRWEANEARKVFASAFALVQANIVAVSKTEDNPQTHSKYAGLDSIIKSSKPIYTKEGFSIIFYEGVAPAADEIRICADVLHTAGHKETYYYDVPKDGVGIKGNTNMTKIHGKASSTSYGRRYLMCMIWNIPTGDDDDGNAACKPVKPATRPQNAPGVSPEPLKRTPMPNTPQQADMVLMAEIADAFGQADTQIALEFKVKDYKLKLQALPEDCKMYLRNECKLAQARIKNKIVPK